MIFGNGKNPENGLSVIETNPLNHNWSDFAILLGLTLHQFQKKTAVKYSNFKTRFEISNKFKDIFKALKFWA